MASNNLVEARADRKDRYRRHWNALIDLSNQQHWCYQDKATREENFEGYYSHMSNQPLTSSYAGGQTPPSIVSIVSPCVVDDLRFKEAGETKAKRRCAEAANAIPNLDCEVVGAEYQL